MAFDFKKEYREFYLPPRKPGIVEVPAMNYVAVRGKGDPNDPSGEYQRALDALYLENPAYREIAIHTIEESEHPEIADQYDYYAVPTFFCGNKKLFEAHLFMSYEAIRDEIRHVLKYAMN